MSPPRFAHVALACSDPRATERYYTRHFGFRRARVIPLGDEQIVFIRLGDMCLELFQAREQRPGALPENDGPWSPGPRHLAFQVDDVDAQIVAMGEDAVPTLGPMDFDSFIPGWRTIWLRDPDGNIVEISQGYVDQTSPPQAGSASAGPASSHHAPGG